MAPSQMLLMTALALSTMSTEEPKEPKDMTVDITKLKAGSYIPARNKNNKHNSQAPFRRNGKG